MSLSYIIEELEKIPDVSKRLKELDRLIPIFYDRLPSGHYNPNDFNSASDTELRRYFNDEKRQFKRLFEVCEYNISPNAARLYSRWMRNVGHSFEILELNKNCSLKLHELFPYWDDFNKQIHHMMKHAHSDIDISKLKFENDFIASGGFGEIYYVKDPECTNDDGNQVGRNNGYILKLFYPNFHYPLVDKLHNMIKTMSLVRDNIHDQKYKNPLPDAFLKIHSFATLYHAEYETSWAYISDYFPGTNVFKMLMDKDKRLSDESLKGRILFTYADVMKTLHENNRLYIDNGLDSILVNNEDSHIIRLCDPDMITDMTRLRDDMQYVHHYMYRSQESFNAAMPTKSSDLESFALMAHNLIIGESYLEITDDVMINLKIAKANHRVYQNSFVKLLPKNLAELLHGLITYPKAENITANDFVQAIKSDYKM